MRHPVFFTLLMAGLLTAGTPGVFGAKARSEAPANDRIDVVGQLAFDGSGVTGVTTGEHWRRKYLYISFGGKITAVDVTDRAKPKIAGEYTDPAASNARVVVGNAALLTDSQPAARLPHSVSIVSFADPAKPGVLRRFTNITGFLLDAPRGLIYVVNNEGLWILQEDPARDLDLEKQFQHELMYNH
jgi:hypothetical protein